MAKVKIDIIKVLRKASEAALDTCEYKGLTIREGDVTMYAIMKTTVMCSGERTERVEYRYPTRHKAKREMRKLYRFLAEKHRPEPVFDEENSIITLPSSAEEVEKARVSYWIWEIVKES